MEGDLSWWLTLETVQRIKLNNSRKLLLMEFHQPVINV